MDRHAQVEANSGIGWKPFVRRKQIGRYTHETLPCEYRLAPTALQRGVICGAYLYDAIEGVLFSELASDCNVLEVQVHRNRQSSNPPGVETYLL